MRTPTESATSPQLHSLPASEVQSPEFSSREESDPTGPGEDLDGDLGTGGGQGSENQEDRPGEGQADEDDDKDEDDDEDEIDEDWADTGPYNFVDWSESVSEESDLFYKIIDEDKINKFEEEFYAALKCQKIAGKRKDDNMEDHDKNVKKSKTK